MPPNAVRRATVSEFLTEGRRLREGPSRAQHVTVDFIDQNQRLCKELLGLYPGIRIEDESTKKGMQLESISLMTNDDSRPDALRDTLTHAYAAGKFMRTPTVPYIRGGAGRVKPLSEPDLFLLEEMAVVLDVQTKSRDAWVRGTARLGRDALLVKWMAAQYDVHPGGLAEYFEVGPFTVDYMEFDVVAERAGTVACTLRGQHMAKKNSYVCLSVPLVYAGLRGLS